MFRCAGKKNETLVVCTLVQVSEMMGYVINAAEVL